MRTKLETTQQYNKRVEVQSGSELFVGYGRGLKEGSDFSKSESGYVAVFATDGTLIEKPISEISGSVFSNSNLYEEIAFSTSIPFNKFYSYMSPYAMGSNLTFTPNATNRIPGAVTLVRLLADGTSTASFSSITEVNSSVGFDSTLNILNYFAFFYDGNSYFVNVYQDKNAQAADIVAPSLMSSSISNSLRKRITLQFNENLNSDYLPSVSDFSIAPSQSIQSLSISSSYLYVSASTNFAYGDTVYLSYSSGSNPLQDAAGNKVQNFVSRSIVNNIAAPDVIAPSFVSASVSDSAKNTIVLWYNEDLDPSSGTNASNFTITGSKIVSSVTFDNNKVNVIANLDYSYGDTILISYNSGSTAIQDLSGNKVLNFTNQAVTNSIAAPPPSSNNVVWTSLQNASDSGSGYLLSNGGTPGGGRSNVSIDATQQFEIVAYFPSNRTITNAIVTYLSVDTNQDYAWSGNVFIIGLYQFSGNFYLPVGGYAATALSTTGTPTSIKLVKSGNNIVVQQSEDDVNYTTRQTVTGALTGQTTIYLKTLFAVPSVTSKIKITYTQ